MEQKAFNQMIGDLDEILSKMIESSEGPDLKTHNRQTLKHHAEDIIGAGQKILKTLGAKG